jgi:hypothetical protein
VQPFARPAPARRTLRQFYSQQRKPLTDLQKRKLGLDS